MEICVKAKIILKSIPGGWQPLKMIQKGCKLKHACYFFEMIWFKLFNFKWYNSILWECKTMIGGIYLHNCCMVHVVVITAST